MTDTVNNKTHLTVDVYKQLLDLVKFHLVGVTYDSVSALVEYEISDVLWGNISLPYNPLRFDGSKKQQHLCDELYPRVKTLITLKGIKFIDFKIALSKKATEMYLIETEEYMVTNRYAIEVALWLAINRYHINIEGSYLLDNEIIEALNIDRIIRESILEVYSRIGHSPTSREYELERKAIGGPSLSFIKKITSFNDAKDKAGLAACRKGRTKKYI